MNDVSRKVNRTAILPDNAMPFEYVFREIVPRIPRWKKDLALAGFPFETAEGRLDVHALRITLGMDALHQGEHPRVVQEMMRHSDTRLTVKLYTDLARLPIAAASAKLPALKVPCLLAAAQREQSGDVKSAS